MIFELFKQYPTVRIFKQKVSSGMGNGVWEMGSDPQQFISLNNFLVFV